MWTVKSDSDQWEQCLYSCLYWPLPTPGQHQPSSISSNLSYSSLAVNAALATSRLGDVKDIKSPQITKPGNLVDTMSSDTIALVQYSKVQCSKLQSTTMQCNIPYMTLTNFQVLLLLLCGISP